MVIFKRFGASGSQNSLKWRKNGEEIDYENGVFGGFKARGRKAMACPRILQWHRWHGPIFSFSITCICIRIHMRKCENFALFYNHCRNIRLWGGQLTRQSLKHSTLTTSPMMFMSIILAIDPTRYLNRYEIVTNYFNCCIFYGSYWFK